MATTVTDPTLPITTGTFLATDIVTFDGDLARVLTSYLQTLAMAINERLPLDGTVPMEGSLDMGGFDITNVDDITADDYNGLGAIPAFQVYLSESGGTLNLARDGGRKLFINSVNEDVPSTAPTLSASGTTTTGGVGGGPVYNIYAYMSSGVLTLEYSSTAYATDTTYGHKIKSGDATRTFVGLWEASAANTWATTVTRGLSYYNPKMKSAQVNANTSTTSLSLVELTSSLRQNFVSLSGRQTFVTFAIGNASHSGSAQNITWNLGLDGASTLIWASSFVNRTSSSAANVQISGYASKWYTASEGAHYVTLLGTTTSGTATYNFCEVLVTVWG